MIDDVVLGVLSAYEEIDKEYKSFSEKAFIKCPPLCGNCCKSPNIEATILEMLPMALEIVTSDKIHQVYSLLDGRQHCVAFIQSMIHQDQGQCNLYQYRPLVCRVFGAMKTKDKFAKSTFSSCQILKQSKITEIKNIEEDQDLLELAPSIGQWSQKIAQIMPSWGSTYYPINEALKQAIDKLILLKDLSTQDHNS